VMPALLVAFVALVVCLGPGALSRAAALSPAFRIGALLLAWTGLSLVWGSSVHALSFARVGGALVMAAGIVLGAGLLNEAAARRVTRFALMGGLVLAMFLFEEGVSGAAVLSWLRPEEAVDPGTIFNLASRGTTILAGMTFVLAVLLYLRLGSAAAAVGFVVAAFTSCWLLTTEAATLAIGLGAIAFVFAYVWPRAVATLTVSVLVFGVLFAPLLPDKLSGIGGFAGSPTATSAAQRIAIWNNTAAMILDKPVLGYGYNASRDYAALDEIIPGTDIRAMPLHPHNGALQIWFELGFVAAALVCGLLVMAGHRLRRMAPLPAATAVATLVATSTIFMLSFSIWQYWWVATLGLTGALLTLTLKTLTAPAASAG